MKAPKAAPSQLPAVLVRGVEVSVSKTWALTAQAAGVGEVSGPAVALEVTLTNQSSSRVSVDGTLVSVTDSTGTPGSEMSGQPASPISGSLAVGSSTKGTYVFTVPVANRDPLVVAVALPGEVPFVEFSITAPRS